MILDIVYNHVNTFELACRVISMENDLESFLRARIFLNTFFVSSHMYPENPEGTQVIVGSMNMEYISDTARNRNHNLFYINIAKPSCQCDLENAYRCVNYLHMISLVYYTFSRSSNSLLAFLLRYQVYATSKIQVNFRFIRNSEVLMIMSCRFP